MASATELPTDLCCDPMSFVVLTGLDVTYNAVHKSIWDAFSNNRRNDRVPISFKCLLGDHAYPRAKDKRTSYEWYIPKGILKTKWMDKHIRKVPAVVVIFYELDWDDSSWREKQMECVSRVEVVRASLQGRGTKVAVVLIQQSSPLPPGEDMGAADRASALCSACDLSAKSLFVLPLTDHLLGYIIRLENAFYELANSYYHTEARRVRAHKEFLNKTTHQLLFVRHQFKIAFFNELMQDHGTASKHYRQAYAHIHELRSHDTNNLEVKVIGGFINYKICRLCFLRHNQPLDAITQFRRHMDLFKPKSGIPELIFEHSAWMSTQFNVFAGLFDEAIKAGLSAIQTQHPGFYYQQAAYYAQDRRSEARNICSSVSDQKYPAPDPLDTNDQPLDFYGQRQWRQGHQSIDPPDANKEKDGILALKLKEAEIDQSRLIIPLLNSAVGQFKKYKCPRMKRFLTVQMGEEFYHSKNYNRAAMHFEHAAWDYRDNKWWDVFNRIQVITLRCAYLVANVQLYISTAIELSGRHSKVSVDDKTRIQMNLIRVVAGEIPEAEPMTPLDKHFDVGSKNDHAEALEKAKLSWNTALSESKVYNIEMNRLVPFVECKASFQKATVHANEAVVLHVYLQTSCPFPIRFTQLNVNVGNRQYDEHCVIKESNTGDLYLEPNKMKHLNFAFCPDPRDVGESIQVSTVTLKFGRDANVILLTWNMLMAQSTHATHLSTKQLMQKDAPAKVRRWSDINPIPSCRILTRQPLLKVKLHHNPPALIHEVYRVTFVMESEEAMPLENVRGSLILESGKPEEVLDSSFLGMDADSVLATPLSKKLEFTVVSLKPGEKYEKSVYIRLAKPGTRNFTASIRYEVFDEVMVPKKEEPIKVQCLCISDHSVSVDAIPAFTLSSSLRNQDFGTFKHVTPGGQFIALVAIECCSPWRVELKSGTIHLSGKVVTTVNDSSSEILEGIILDKGEMANDAICLVCKRDTLFDDLSNVAIGQYALSWRRLEKNSSDPLPFVSSSAELATATIRSFPLKIDVTMPSSGEMLKQMPITYTMRNDSDEPRELEIICEVAENFMFSGVKLQRSRILPQSELSLTYALYPLAAGFQALPAFRIKEIPSDGRDPSIPETDEVLSCSYLRERMPVSIFIKPGERSCKLN